LTGAGASTLATGVFSLFFDASWVTFGGVAGFFSSFFFGVVGFFTVGAT